MTWDEQVTIPVVVRVYDGLGDLMSDDEWAQMHHDNMERYNERGAHSGVFEKDGRVVRWVVSYDGDQYRLDYLKK